MVTKPDKPNPSAAEGLREVKLANVEPAELATNASMNPKYQAGPKTAVKDPTSQKQDLSNKDHNASFKLPDKVSAADVKDESYRYGGGRSAGNRSLEANRQIEKKVP